MNFNERTYLWYIALLRVWIGYYFLQQGIGKYQGGFPGSDWIRRQIGDIATLEIYPWYKTLLQNYVAPYGELFGYLVTMGEIGVGISLLLGFFTRFGALIGLFMLSNYYLAIGILKEGAILAQQRTFIVCLLVFLLANPGRALGLDGLLFRKGKGLR